jgi:hypothetical protein
MIDVEEIGSNTFFTWLSHFFYSILSTNVIENITLKWEIVQGNPFDEFDNTLWKQMDKFLTLEELGCLRGYPPYSPHLFPAVSNLLQQELQVL